MNETHRAASSRAVCAGGDRAYIVRAAVFGDWVLNQLVVAAFVFVLLVAPQIL